MLWRRMILCLALAWNSWHADASAIAEIPTVVVAMFPDPPNSFDPIDALALPNLQRIMALYALPLEWDDVGRYRSSILSRFDYSDKTHTLNFYLKPGLVFDDGSPLTLDDLAFAVARYAYLLPESKLIRDVVGLTAWRKLPSPLRSFPEGFRLDTPTNHLAIRFTAPQPNPFFLFTAPWLGVVPRSAVNLDSGKLNRKMPSFSGPFALVATEPSGYLLERRSAVAPVSFPQKLRIILVDPAGLGPMLQRAHRQMVIIVDSAACAPQDQATLQRDFRSPPGSDLYVEGAYLNNTPGMIFADRRMRQFFGEEMRRSVRELGVDPSLGFRDTLILYSCDPSEVNNDKAKHSFDLFLPKGETVDWPDILSKL